MRKKRSKTEPVSEMPQTSIPGAVGSIFSPRDAKTGEPIPTDGRCVCGSTENRVEKEAHEVVRICNKCGLVISSARL